MKKVCRKIIAGVLAVIMAVTGLCDSQLTTGIFAAEFDTSGYKQKYGITYEELFKLPKQYLEPENINIILNNIYDDANEAAFVAQQNYSESEFIHNLDKGISGTIKMLLGEVGVTETEYEKYRDDVVTQVLRDYFQMQDEDSALIKEMSSGVGQISKVYDFTTDVSEFAQTWSAIVGDRWEEEEIKKFVNEVLQKKSVNSWLGNTQKVFNVMVEMFTLQELEYRSLDMLIESVGLYCPDSELYQGLVSLKNKIDADPVAYALGRFATDEIIDKIAKAVEEYAMTALIGSKAAAFVAVATDLIVTIYEWKNPSYEEIQKVFIAGIFYREINDVLSLYRKDLKKSYTDRKERLYETAYNMQLSVLKKYLDAGIDIVKKEKEYAYLKNKLEMWKEFITNQLSYQSYIESCMAFVKKDLDAGILTISEDKITTPADAENYSSVESIKSKFAAIQAVYIPNVGMTWNGSCEGAIQCFGFARMVFQKLFGCSMSYHYDYYNRYEYTDETNVTLVAQVAGADVNETSVKNVLQQGKLGDIIQASGALYGQHTMVFVSADDEGVTVYDCNAKLSSTDPDCLIGQRKMSYAVWVRYYGTSNSITGNGISLYHADNYESIYGNGDGMFYDDSVNFVIEDGCLTKYNGWQSFVSIPDTVTSIGEGAFKNNKSVISVEIPDSVKSIGSSAFYGCSKLAGVYIPDSVESIGSAAFEECSSLATARLPENEKFETIESSTFRECVKLTKIEIPDSVTSIGNSAFANCKSLTKIEIPDSVKTIERWAFNDCENVTEIKLSKNIEIIGDKAFGNCKLVEGIEIPKSLDRCGIGVFTGCSYLKNIIFEEGITQIAECLFYDCDSIEEIEIPDTVTIIENSAFSGSDNLKKVIIPDSVTYIGGWAFENCKSLTKIEIPDSVTDIGDCTFKNCENVTEIKLSKKIESIGYGAFENCKLVEEIEIPKSLDSCSVKYWSNGVDVTGVFTGCLNLKKITFEEGATQIAQWLFCNCDSIEEIEIPDTVTIIENCAFENSDNLKKVIIPESVSNIESSAFANCKSLENIEIPDNVTSIGKSAFENCKSLTKIEIPDSVTDIDTYAFYNCENVTEIKLSKKIESIEYGAFANCKLVEEIEIPKSLKGYSCPFYGCGVFTGCSNLKNIIFEKGITQIAENLFYDCDSIEEIEIPDTVTIIEGCAFSKSDNLKKVTIPASVTSIDYAAFSGCKSLDNIEIPDSVTSIGSSAFDGCTSLKSAKLPNTLTELSSYLFNACEKLESISIPDTVKYIRNYAFYGCDSLTEITIPESVELIEKSAFRDSALLSSVNINADSGYTIGQYAFSDCPELKNVTMKYAPYTIGDYAFYNAGLVEEIIIPYGTTNIGSYAFANEVKLTSISIPRTVTAMGSNVFSYPSKMTINGVSGTYAETYAKENGIGFVNKEVKATKISLSITELTLEKWEKEQLKLSIEPFNYTDEVIWKSSDEDVVTISEKGEIRAVGIGSANIKVIAGDVSCVCKVTVVQPVTNININAYSIDMDALDTYQLEVSVYPDNAANKNVVWSSSDETIATVSQNGLVKALKKGTAVIKAEATDSSGEYDECSINVKNNITLCESTTGFESEHDYPSGSSDMWMFKSDNVNKITLTFDARTEVENGFDYIYILDKNKEQVGKYTGTELAGKSVSVSGDTVYVKLESDNAGNKWGFMVTEIVVDDKNSENAETPEKPTTEEPTTEKPTTEEPTTEKPTTEEPTTGKPIVEQPTTGKPTVEEPTTGKPTVEQPTTGKPTVEKPTTDKTDKDTTSNNKKTVAVQKIKVSKSSLTLEVGKSVTIKTTVTPSNATNKKLTYKSSNTKVATVSSKGVIKAKKVGTATITVKSNNGKKATVKVNVKLSNKMLKLSKTKITVKKNKFQTVIVTITRGTTDKLSVKASNSSAKATIKGKKITVKGRKKGKLTITVKCGSKSQKIKVTVK